MKIAPARARRTPILVRIRITFARRRRGLNFFGARFPFLGGLKLLAGLQVRDICVVCLLNRMGRETTEFLRRTQQLVRGLGDAAEDAEDSVRPRRSAPGLPRLELFPVLMNREKP